MKLRSISIGDKIEIEYGDNDDEKTYVVSVDISKMEIKWDKEKLNTKIELNDPENYIVLKIPSASVYASPAFEKEDVTEQELLEALIVGCMDRAVINGKTETFENAPVDELLEWMNQLPVSAYAKIKTFVSNLPTIYLTSGYTNANGKVRKFEYKTLNDFFIYL
jgi:hypothetical protein